MPCSLKYDCRLYNNDRKERFLNNEYPNPSTKKTNYLYLTKIGIFEKDKNKDLCDFSYEELKELLVGLKRESENSLNVIFSVITKYFDWCIYEEYITYPTHELITKQDKQNAIHRQQFFKREQIYNLCDGLYNYVDKALIICLYENIKGRPETNNSFEEIRNLKKTDIYPDINRVILTRNNGDSRFISVNNKTMEILVRARDEVEYFKENGLATGRFATRPLRKTEYLFRTIENGSFSFNNDNRINIASIENKFRSFRRYLDIDYLNATIIFDSGLIEKCEIKAKELINGVLKPEHFKQILKRLQLNENIYFTLKQKYNLHLNGLNSRS